MLGRILTNHIFFISISQTTSFFGIFLCSFNPWMCGRVHAPLGAPCFNVREHLHFPWPGESPFHLSQSCCLNAHCTDPYAYRSLYMCMYIHIYLNAFLFFCYCFRSMAKSLHLKKMKVKSAYKLQWKATFSSSTRQWD